MLFVIPKKSHIFSFYIATWFNFVPVFLIHPVFTHTYEQIHIYSQIFVKTCVVKFLMHIV